MNQTITIDKEPYVVDQTVADAIGELENEIITLRNMLVRLAVFVNGNPCWCRCEGGKHSKVCRDILKLRLWPRPVRGNPTNGDHLPWK